ncbi:hypothetical protein B9G98_01618 [Wickerhamiella sorbophila]|uniref:PI31 proteasome regulator C-terminal domain-containing protein n=1 Tax=Wickerhamiella sorbophila TaxID=45607 RepID=A0A2T0FG80_9ASCO|nr:hypothetical protein B9G98_01618 [Wickerhamiella sorbophila]PRT53998.1 hypothetical protein B9G98_01618 [Wickerhamiella sorbophila]
MTNKKEDDEEATLEYVVETLLNKTLEEGASQDYYSCESNGRQVVIARAQPGFVVSYTEPFVSAHLKTKDDVRRFQSQIHPQKPHKYYPDQPRIQQSQSHPSGPSQPSRPDDMPQFEDEHEMLNRSAAPIANPAFGIGEADLYPLGKYPSFEPGMPGASGGMHPTPFGQNPHYNQRWDPPAPGAQDPRDPSTGLDALSRGFTPKGGPPSSGYHGFPGGPKGFGGPDTFGGGFL